MMVTPWCTISLPGSVSSQLPPCSAAMSTITEPALIASTICAVTRTGARFPGTSAVVMHASVAFNSWSKSSLSLRAVSALTSLA